MRTAGARATPGRGPRPITAWGFRCVKVPAILREFTGIRITQSALTQDAMKKAEGAIGNAYQELRDSSSQVPPLRSSLRELRQPAVGAHAFDGFGVIDTPAGGAINVYNRSLAAAGTATLASNGVETKGVTGILKM